jgi:hypothetical protein
MTKTVLIKNNLMKYQITKENFLYKLTTIILNVYL